jgi:mono/diheme cytochrome c family protein
VAANYSSIAANILVPGCTVCHGNSGGYSFASYADTMQAVTPGNPGASMLYLAVSQGVMPKGGPNLSAEQVKAVGDWISAGAAND